MLVGQLKNGAPAVAGIKQTQKAIIKNTARNKNISASLVLQNYMLERFWKEFPYPGIMTTISSKADF